MSQNCLGATATVSYIHIIHLSTATCHLYGIYPFKKKCCVSLQKKKDLQETQSVYSLLTASEATPRRHEYCEKAFMPLQKDVRQTDAKTSLSLSPSFARVALCF